MAEFDHPSQFIPVLAPIATLNSDSNNETHIDRQGKGGFRVEPTLASRNLIKPRRRVRGMWVKVQENGLMYELKMSASLTDASLTNADWELISLSGGSGGHVIQDADNNTLPSQPILKFEGATVTDDPINNKTVVSITGSGGSPDLIRAAGQEIVYSPTGLSIENKTVSGFTSHEIEVNDRVSFEASSASIKGLDGSNTVLSAIYLTQADTGSGNAPVLVFPSWAKLSDPIGLTLTIEGGLYDGHTITVGMSFFGSEPGDAGVFTSVYVHAITETTIPDPLTVLPIFNPSDIDSVYPQWGSLIEPAIVQNALVLAVTTNSVELDLEQNYPLTNLSTDLTVNKHHSIVGDVIVHGNLKPESIDLPLSVQRDSQLANNSIVKKLTAVKDIYARSLVWHNGKECSNAPFVEYNLHTPISSVLTDFSSLIKIQNYSGYIVGVSSNIFINLIACLYVNTSNDLILTILKLNNKILEIHSSIGLGITTGDINLSSCALVTIVVHSHGGFFFLYHNSDNSQAILKKINITQFNIILSIDTHILSGEAIPTNIREAYNHSNLLYVDIPFNTQNWIVDLTTYEVSQIFSGLRAFGSIGAIGGLGDNQLKAFNGQSIGFTPITFQNEIDSSPPRQGCEFFFLNHTIRVHHFDGGMNIYIRYYKPRVRLYRIQTNNNLDTIQNATILNGRYIVITGHDFDPYNQNAVIVFDLIEKRAVVNMTINHSTLDQNILSSYGSILGEDIVSRDSAIRYNTFDNTFTVVKLLPYYAMSLTASEMGQEKDYVLEGFVGGFSNLQVGATYHAILNDSAGAIIRPYTGFADNRFAVGVAVDENTLYFKPETELLSNLA